LLSEVPKQNNLVIAGSTNGCDASMSFDPCMVLPSATFCCPVTEKHIAENKNKSFPTSACDLRQKERIRKEKSKRRLQKQNLQNEDLGTLQTYA